jgi:hypothetical protein
MAGRYRLAGALPPLFLLGAGSAAGDPPVLRTEIYDAPVMVKAGDEIVISVRVRNISDDAVRLLIGHGPFGLHTEYMIRADRLGSLTRDSDFPHGRDEPRPLLPGAVREDRFSIYDRIPDLPPGSYSISVAPIVVAGENQVTAGWSGPVRITVK